MIRSYAPAIPEQVTTVCCFKTVYCGKLILRTWTEIISRNRKNQEAGKSYAGSDLILMYPVATECIELQSKL